MARTEEVTANLDGLKGEAERQRALGWIPEEDYREILELCGEVEALFEE
ncbi:MAG: hypothetical protein HY694_16270 [Deltaproteobacteria bacterium]|nr:hypothetical protein [Deltaproteobacteria bacterium]